MAFGFFDGQKADSSPESIKRKRAMIAQLLSGGRAPRNIGEGFSSIGDSVAAAILGARADAEEKASNASSAEAMRNIYSGFGSPMASAGNPVATGRATGSGATDAVSGKGYDNPQARETYEYALAQGLAPHQAAAYTGAKLAESRFNPNARNPGDGRDGSDSIGGFQWNSGRAQALKQYAAQQGKSWNDPAVQRAFSFAELNGSERAAGQALRNAKTPEEATAAMLSYLRPGGWTARNPLGAHSAPARLRNTQGILSAFGNMPVINPGPGATPMPLARQQAQTAPMPNAGLADLPAPGANQSASNVAPVQGDNPQQLLADADYYEQNGNVEAARQMRERAAMAGQPAPAAAFPLPEDGSQPNPLRDMFSARGVGFADNEAETQGFEARMAQDQAGAPAPDPSQVQTVAITPNAQNADDVFSPIPMGIGPNPFVPRDAAPPADVAAQGADQTAVSPRMVTAPMPPPRPADLRPQSPFVPPAMRAPLPVDMGGENSGGSAMQFIESEFARREGRPDPRAAIGAPGQYNPFVPQSLQAPQMAGDGGSVQGASQGGAMAGGAAQPQQAGMITPQNVRAVMSSPFTSDADKRFVMDMWNQQQARAMAEAERARVQAQNDAAADALKIDRRLGGVPAAVAAAAKANFDRKFGQAKRSLQPVYGTDAQGNTVVLQLGDDGTVSQSQLPKDVKIASGVDRIDAGTKFLLQDKRTGAIVGEVPKDIAGAERAKVIGKDEGERVVNAPGEIRVADAALKTLEQIKTHPGREGWGAQGPTAALPWISRAVPGTPGRDFVALVEQAQGQAFLQAFESLKGGGAITEAEGKAATAAIARLDRTQSRQGFDAALKDIQTMLETARDRARRNVRVLPDGTEVPAGPAAPAAPGASKVLRYNPKTGALE